MKRFIIALLAVSFGLALAGAACADVDINVYGASAQFNFWSNEATVWLASPTGGNCTGGVVSSAAGGVTTVVGCGSTCATHGQKYFYAHGTTCGAIANGNITVRVTAGDSVDGVTAVAGDAYYWNNKVPGGHLDPMSCPGGTRTMMDNTAGTAFSCHPVTFGAADVTPDLFTQKSLIAGSYFDGPSGAMAAWGPVNTTTVGAIPDVSTLTHYQPVVVPFGVWLNNSVQVSTCTGQAAGKIDAGTPCTVAAQCSSGVCGAPANVTNMPLEWISQIFTGKVDNWNQLNSAFAHEPITVCLRVPGSGTMAAFDYSVIKRVPNYTLPTKESHGNVYPAAAPNVWYNFTSGDMESCVKTQPGAIGLCDADDSKINGNGGYGPVMLEGQMPTRTNIRTGLYDYFTVENLYLSAACTAGSDPADNMGPLCAGLAQNFFQFASLPANIGASGRALYASSAEMLVSKSDIGYPSPIIGGAQSLCELTGAALVGGENPGANCTGNGAVCVGSTMCTVESCAGNPAVPALCP